jgi:two-component system, LytTR family, response regulator
MCVPPPMRVLIVDDEPLARKVLREELELLDSVEVVAEAEDGETALQKTAEMRLDVVFLDVQMPIMDGFEFLRRLSGGPLPAVVLVTAYDQHAIRAFEAGAVDYLLKPVSPERLRQALDRVNRMRTSPKAVAESLVHAQEITPDRRPLQSRIRKIVGRIGEEYFLLPPEEIFAFQADGDLVFIITGQRRYYATQNLKTIADRLENTSFRRLHRNAIVNLDHVRKASMLTSQRWRITLNNGDEFIVSKRQAKNMREVLQW